MKADTWDAFHQTGSPQEFKSRFDKLSLPDEAKAHLWDMKFGAAPKAAPSPLPPPSMAAKIGSYIPQSALPTLQAIQKYAVDPFEHMAQAGAQAGHEMGTDLVQGVTGLFHPPTLPSNYGPMPQLQQYSAAKEHPVATGIAQGVGETAGGIAGDPRMWALGLESGAKSAVSRLMSAGFSAQMLHGAYTSVPLIRAAIDRGDLAETARLMTSAGLSLAGGAMAGIHAATPAAEMAASPAEKLTGERSAAEQPSAPPASYESLKSTPIAVQSLSEKGSPSEVQVPPSAKMGEQAALQSASTTAQSEVANKITPSSETDGKPIQTPEGKEVAGLGPRGQFAKPDADRIGERGSLSLGPKDENIGTPGPGTMDRLASKINSALYDTPEVEETKNIIRRRGAEVAQTREQLLDKFAKVERSYNGYTTEQLRTFMDAGEGRDIVGPQPLDSTGIALAPGKAQFSTPRDRAVAEALHAEFDPRWDRVKEIQGRDDDAGIDNYLKHLFKGKDSQDIVSKILGKRDLQGPATFNKKRVHAYLSEAIDAGAVPVTNNPVTMQLLGLRELDKYISAHDTKDDLVKGGTAKWWGISGQRTLKDGSVIQRPRDWEKLDDRIFQPRLMKDGARLEYGNYWAPPEVAKIFNEHLAPGLQGSKLFGLPIYDTVRSYGNALNQFQLSASAFHAVFSTISASTNDMALGLMKAFNSKDVGGAAKYSGRGTLPGVSAFLNYRLGKHLEEEYITPGRHPELQGLVDALKDAGGRKGMDPTYSNQAINEFSSLWQKQNKSPAEWGKMTSKGLQTFAEKTSAWIMKYYVPRLKLGAFAEMLNNRVAEVAKSGDTVNLPTEAGKIWDSVDNRMGQLTYDNLFWKKTHKDVGMLSVRSLGWTLGSIREFGGAGADAVKLMSSKVRDGRRAELSPRLAYALSVPIVVAITGAVKGYLTGHPPHDPIDYMFPQNGTINAVGNPGRDRIPGYLNDIVSMHEHPIKTLVNKAHPMLGELADIYTNHDFYNTEIRDTDAPILTQAHQISSYLLKQAVPFGIANTIKEYQQGGGKASIAAELGFTPAPEYIGETKAQELAYDNAKRHMEAGPHTPDQFEAQKAYANTRAQYASGKLSEDDLMKLIDSGKLPVKQAQHIMQSVNQSPLERHATANHLDELLHVWDRATPSEKEVLKPILLKKAHTIASYPPEQQDALQERLEKIFIDEEK